MVYKNTFVDFRFDCATHPIVFAFQNQCVAFVVANQIFCDFVFLDFNEWIKINRRYRIM